MKDTIMLVLKILLILASLITFIIGVFCHAMGDPAEAAYFMGLSISLGLSEMRLKE